jgi:hypothetical protein
MKKRTVHEFTQRFGKMVKGLHSLLLDEDQLSDTQNMEPGYSWKQRKGMATLTATPVASGLRFKTMVQYRDIKGNTDAIIAVKMFIWGVRYPLTQSPGPRSTT